MKTFTSFIHKAVLLALVMVGCLPSCAQTVASPRHLDNIVDLGDLKNVIRNQHTARSVSMSILEAHFGEKEVAAQLPLNVKLSKDRLIWEVTGNAEAADRLGTVHLDGVIYIDLDRNRGAVKRLGKTPFKYSPSALERVGVIPNVGTAKRVAASILEDRFGRRGAGPESQPLARLSNDQLKWEVLWSGIGHITLERSTGAVRAMMRY